MGSTATSPGFAARTLGPLASQVILAWGWPRRFIALLAGGVGALALPPVGALPALFVSMMAAVWLLDGSADQTEGGRGASLRAAFAAGWWWGFGFFLASLWWLGAAFLVDAAQYAWAMPLAVVGLPACLAVFPGLGFALARRVWPAGRLRPLALAAGLAFSEWLRAVVLTGFPWNELGMAAGQSLPLAQAASLFGLHGLTLATIFIAAAPATLWDAGAGWRRLAPSLVAAGRVVALLAFGLQRLSETAPPPVSGVKLRLMQSNISQGPEFGPDKGAEILGRYLALSDRATSPERQGVADVTHLFWPESAFPFVLSRDAGAMARIADFLRSGAVLTTGAARMEADRAQRNHWRYYNSIEVLDRTGLLAARYDKKHLVPFGEYLPFEAWVRATGLNQFVTFPGGFTSGSGSQDLQIPGLPDAIALVCYEAIFPNEWPGLRAGDLARARWILNVTDDAWFGLTAGPYQHFVQARLRAVEWGLPLVRVGNGGISAIVDAYGRIERDAPLGAETVIDGELPGALAPTLQARWGSVTFGTLLSLSLIVCWVASRRR